MPTLDYTTWMMPDGSDEWIEYVISVEVSQDELTALSFNWHGKTTADTLGRMASIAHVTILADYWACACGDRAVRMVSTPNYFPNPASGPAVVEDLVPLPCCGSPKCRLQALRYTDTLLKTQHRDVKTEMPGSALPVSSFLNSFRSGQQYKCAHCGKEQGRDEAKKAGTMKRCGRCKTERYCDRDCQRSHWRSGHEQACMARRHAGGEGEGEGEGGGLLLQLGEALDALEAGELLLRREGFCDPTELLGLVEQLLGERCEVVDTRHARIGLRSKWPGVSGQWLAVSGRWLAVSGRWSGVSGQWSVVSGQWSVVSGQ
jgi:hypothetical protein